MQVMTVAGPVDASELGVVLPHEHLLINFRREIRSGLMNDVNLACEEVDLFVRAGGGTIVDTTSAELTDGSVGMLLDEGTELDRGYDRTRGTRSPANVAALVEISKRTGVHVVAGTGHYRDPYLDHEWFDRHPAEAIAEYMVRDIEEGFPNSAVRAGIIGEIGSDKWYLSAVEERSFRAAAIAHRRTGLAVTTHATGWPVGLTQAQLLMSEGVAPERIIIGHVDAIADPRYPLALARTGVFVELDLFCTCMQGGVVNQRQLDTRMASLAALVDGGYIDQVLISHDVYLRDHLRARGGTGYAFILTHVADAMARHGLNAEVFDQLTKVNPRRALTG